MLRTFASMVNLIAPEVSTCPDPLIEKTLLDISRDFCTRTTFYRKEIDPVVPVTGQTEYDLVPPDGYEVSAIAYAWFNGVPLTPMVRRPVSKPSGITPTSHLYPSLNKIGLHPIPNDKTSGDVEVMAILRPALDASGADDEILGRFESAIVHGSLGKLMSMNKKPWTNLQLSDFHTKAYRRERGEALVEALRGSTNYRHAAYPEIV